MNEQASTEHVDTDQPLDASERAPWGPDKRPFLRWVAAATLVVALVYCLSPVVLNGDSYLLVPTATSLVHHGDLNLDEYQNLPKIADHYANIRADGHYFNEFPWVESLFFVPVVVAVDVLHKIGVGPGMNSLIARDQMGPIQLVVASLVTALVAGLVMALAFERLRGTRQRRKISLGVGLLFAFGTSAWSTASRALWQHGPSMLCLTSALIAASMLERRSNSVRQRDRLSFALGIAVAMSYVMRPTNLLAVVLLTAWLLLRHRRHWLPYGVGAVVVAAPWFAVNLISIRRLMPLYNNSDRVGWHHDYIKAFFGDMFSPARGLLVFTPLVVLSIIGFVLGLRTRRAAADHGEFDGLAWVSLAYVVLLWLAIAGFEERWWAGDSFGPRFFTDALPFLVLLALPCVTYFQAIPSGARVRRIAVAVLAVTACWSVAVHAEGSVLRASSCWNVSPVDLATDPGRIWSWRDAQFTRGYRRLISDGPRGAILARCDKPSA